MRASSSTLAAFLAALIVLSVQVHETQGLRISTRRPSQCDGDDALIAFPPSASNASFGLSYTGNLAVGNVGQDDTLLVTFTAPTGKCAFQAPEPLAPDAETLKAMGGAPVSIFRVAAASATRHLLFAAYGRRGLPASANAAMLGTAWRWIKGADGSAAKFRYADDVSLPLFVQGVDPANPAQYTLALDPYVTLSRNGNAGVLAAVGQRCAGGDACQRTKGGVVAVMSWVDDGYTAGILMDGGELIVPPIDLSANYTPSADAPLEYSTIETQGGRYALIPTGPRTVLLLEPGNDARDPAQWAPFATVDVGKPASPTGEAFGALAGLHMPSIEWLVAVVKGANGGGYVSIFRSKRAKDPYLPVCQYGLHAPPATYDVDVSDAAVAEGTHLRVACTLSVGAGAGAALSKQVLSFPVDALQRGVCGAPKHVFSSTAFAGDDALEMTKDGFTLMMTSFNANRRDLSAQSMARGRRRRRR